MTTKVFQWPASMVVFAVAFSFSAGISSAQRARSETESGRAWAMQQIALEKEETLYTIGKVKANKAEESAFKALLAAQYGDPSALVQLAEVFVTKFPTSQYLPAIYGVLTTSYFATGEMDKMFAAGARAVQLDPGNVDVMSLLAMAIPRRVKAGTQEGAEQLQVAEVYAHRAIEAIPAMAKPAELNDAAFAKAKNDELALAHSGLGAIAIAHQKYDEARTELIEAVRLASSPDPVDYYLLGITDMKGSYYQDAIEAYEQCAVPGPLMVTCKDRAESAKHYAETKMGR